MNARKSREQRRAPRGQQGPKPLALLSKDERGYYLDILAEGQAAVEALNRAQAQLQAAAERVTEQRGALYSFACRVAKKRGLDVRAIRIEPDGRVLPAVAEVPPVEPPAGDQVDDASGAADAAIAELNQESA